MRKIYLAARYGRRNELCMYKKSLELRGFVVTSRWLNGECQIGSNGAPIGDNNESLVESGEGRDAWDLRLHLLANNTVDVMSADTLIAFTEEPRNSHSRGGRHVEFGIALAESKRLVVIGPRENLFYYHPFVFQYDDWSTFVTTEISRSEITR